MDQVLAPPTTPTSERLLATWGTGHPWLWGVAIGVGGTVLTAFGIGFGQARQLDPMASTYTQAAFVALSAVVGLIVMWRTRPSLREYGFRRPRHLERALWLIPLAVIPIILVVFVGVQVSPEQVLAYGVLSVAVGFNEEIWFRGLLLASLRSLGTRRSVVGGAVIFGALHLSNLFAGSPPLELALQFAFACLAGFVLAEIVTITGSLWVGIIWHVVYDAVALSTGDQLTPSALAALVLMTVVLAVYAGWLWRRLPADAPVPLPAG